MSIRIFATGGTFDKEYDEIKEILYFGDTHVKHLLELGRTTLEIDIRTLMMIDSLNMTEQDRQLILESCEDAPEEEIVITHGTGTMTNTARCLGEAGNSGSAVKDKTIVLVGAMVPYRFSDSDALFNLGVALAFVQVLHPGVYIAMNGRYFLWNNVQKNLNTGEFEKISGGQ